jgi:hypothetical protein
MRVPEGLIRTPASQVKCGGDRDRATPCPPPAAEDIGAYAATAAAVQRLRLREVFLPQPPAGPKTLTSTAGLGVGDPPPPSLPLLRVTLQHTR